VENNVTMNRITTIPMPHKGATPMLRPREVRTGSGVGKGDGQPTQGNTAIQKRSNIDWLKVALDTNSKGELVMTRKMIAQGWLNKMLVEAGVIKVGEVARKERCFADFQAQLLYIEGMKAVLGDEYDPRHAARAFGENGKYKPTNKWKNEANPDGQLCTVQYVMLSVNVL
jgi:hypothetical protein